VHARDQPGRAAALRRRRPAAELFIHPECGCSTAALWQAGEGDLPAGRTRVLSTGGMLAAARATTAPTVLVATETGMLHQLRRANPAVRWEPVNADAVCRYMKMTTPAALLRCLREGVEEVNVAPGVADRAPSISRDLASPPATAVRGTKYPLNNWYRQAGPLIRPVTGVTSAVRRELRRLPRSPLRWAWRRDVVVVWFGAAGITAALTAAARRPPRLLLSKDGIGGGATPLAQGGLAAALGPGDTPALHQRDTLDAGAGLCDPAAVAALVAEAPGEIARLGARGARLERTVLHLEGGHSRNRIVTAGGDAIGAEVHRVLRAALLASRVQVLTRCVVLDALTGDQGPVGGVLAGVVGQDGALAGPGRIVARTGPAGRRGDRGRVVLATGGFGWGLRDHHNPAGLTGDGLWLAARGKRGTQEPCNSIRPCVAGRGPRPVPLIRGAARGGGAGDAAGQLVMAGRHPLGDLAPRDGGGGHADGPVPESIRRRMGDQNPGRPRRGRPGRPSLAGRHQAGPRRAGAGFPHGGPAVPGARDRPGGRADPGRARRALRLRRHPGRPGRADLGPRAVRRRGSRLDRGTRRRPPAPLPRTEALITGRRTGEPLGRDLPEPLARLRLPSRPRATSPPGLAPPRLCPGTPG
jgi:L-aspartate oxidase